MERTVTNAGLKPAVAGWSTPVLDRARLAMLGRYALFTACLFAVSAFAVAVRLDVQQLRKDLDRNTRMQREAGILNDRLHLEMDARRRATAVEVLASQLALGPEARIVRVEATAP